MYVFFQNFLSELQDNFLCFVTIVKSLSKTIAPETDATMITRLLEIHIVTGAKLDHLA